MRALWLIRKNLESEPGGDTVQILRTARALAAEGLDLEIATCLPARLDGFDLVHLFHLDRLWENLPHCRELRRRGRPVVLSPIYWPGDDFSRAGRVGTPRLLARAFGEGGWQSVRNLGHWARACVEGDRALWDAPFGKFRAAARFVLETAAVLLPNSELESRALREGFGVERPTICVPNAVAIEEFRPPASDLPRRGILSVGRLEPRKNQLALVRALAGSAEPLTLVGRAASRSYLRRLRAEAGPGVRFVPWCEGAELAAHYQRARVHACPSWYETPGLASLEAASAGAAIVVTPGGSTREYFGDGAHYADPGDPRSLREAVEAALESGPSLPLGERVRREYRWENAARATRVGYELALGKSSAPRAAERSSPGPLS